MPRAVYVTSHLFVRLSRHTCRLKPYRRADCYGVNKKKWRNKRNKIESCSGTIKYNNQITVHEAVLQNIWLYLYNTYQSYTYQRMIINAAEYNGVVEYNK